MAKFILSSANVGIGITLLVWEVLIRIRTGEDSFFRFMLGGFLIYLGVSELLKLQKTKAVVKR